MNLEGVSWDSKSSKIYLFHLVAHSSENMKIKVDNGVLDVLDLSEGLANEHAKILLKGLSYSGKSGIIKTLELSENSEWF